MNRLLVLLLALGVVCGASSCSLWRRVTGRRKAAPVADSTAATARPDSSRIAADTAVIKRDTVAVNAAPAADPQKQAMIQQWLQLWNTQAAYNTFSGKAKVHYEGKGDNQDFTAVIRMEKDKRIWISITALGLFEAARALITPDTIIAIDRIHKEVRVLPFSEADKLLPVHADFATLQSLIIGDVLHTGRPLTDVTDTGAAFWLSATAQDFFQQASFNKKDTAMDAQTLSAGGALLQSLYYNYKPAGARRFANNHDLSMTDKGALYQISLDFSRVAFDEPVDMSFSIPERYERK